MRFKPDQEDIFVWADDTNCYRCELPEMDHMSDDFRVVYFEDTENYAAECKRLGLDC